MALRVEGSYVHRNDYSMPGLDKHFILVQDRESTLFNWFWVDPDTIEILKEATNEP